jgi:hypothetical protein
MLLVTGGTGYLGAALLVSGRAAGGTALVDRYSTYPRLGINILDSPLPGR